MCLPIAVRNPELVLAQGEHAGFEWMVTNNGIGYRCGYVRVPPGHPWYGQDADSIDAEAHWGLNFAIADEPCEKGGADNGWWLGFDCAHAWDLPDPSLPSPADRQGLRAVMEAYPMPESLLKDMAIRDQAYVEANCRCLCEQARDAALVTIDVPATE